MFSSSRARILHRLCCFSLRLTVIQKSYVFPSTVGWIKRWMGSVTHQKQPISTYLCRYCTSKDRLELCRKRLPKTNTVNNFKQQKNHRDILGPVYSPCELPLVCCPDIVFFARPDKFNCTIWKLHVSFSYMKSVMLMDYTEKNATFCSNTKLQSGL